jgi:hypothetical protein
MKSKVSSAALTTKALAFAGAIVAACGLASSAAKAVPGCANTNPNLVTNGGFETGDFTGWTVGWADTHVLVSSAHPYTGANHAALGSGSLNTLSQQITGTTAGSIYQVCFFLGNAIDGSQDQGTPSTFEVRWNGLPVLTLIDSLPTGYVRYRLAVRATGNDTLSFDHVQVPHFWFLDGVAVQAGTATPFAITNAAKRP